MRKVFVTILGVVSKNMKRKSWAETGRYEPAMRLGVPNYSIIRGSQIRSKMDLIELFCNFFGVHYKRPSLIFNLVQNSSQGV